MVKPIEFCTDTIDHSSSRLNLGKVIRFPDYVLGLDAQLRKFLGGLAQCPWELLFTKKKTTRVLSGRRLGYRSSRMSNVQSPMQVRRRLNLQLIGKCRLRRVAVRSTERVLRAALS